MTTTPVLGLNELASGQAIPETTVNESNRWLEFFASGGKVLDRDLIAQPGSPVDGDAYLLPVTPTGTNWAGQGGKIALRISTAWEFKTAKEGMTLYVADEDLRIVYDGAAWQNSSVSGGISEATAVEVWTGTATTKYVSPDKLLDAAAPTALVDGATVTPDFNAGFNFEWTIGGSRTLANPSNAKSGQSGTIKVVQDATGSRIVTYGNNWRFPGGSASAGVLSTAANATDLIAYTVGTDGKIYATLSKAFAA